MKDSVQVGKINVRLRLSNGAFTSLQLINDFLEERSRWRNVVQKLLDQRKHLIGHAIRLIQVLPLSDRPDHLKNVKRANFKYKFKVFLQE